MASFLEILKSSLSPKALIPYTIPKFTAFALRRCSGVTSFNGMWNTCDAVMAWISWAVLYASIRRSSPDIWARTRSSIWE